MIEQHLVYDALTGAIRARVGCPPDQLAAQLGPGEKTIPGDARDDLFYVDVARLKVTPKQDYPLDKLPLPCTVTIEGQQYRCTEQPEFEFDVPGTYRIEVDAGARFLVKEFVYAYPPSDA